MTEPSTLNEYRYIVKKFTVKGDRVWLTVSDAIEKEFGRELQYAAVISLPKAFSFEPKEVIIKG